MASSQWLKDNPKVLGYVPQHVYQHLQMFTVERELSISKALTLILAEYFELEPASLPLPESLRHDVKLSNLEQDVKDLQAKVAALNNTKQQNDAMALTQNSHSTQSDGPRRTLSAANCKIPRVEMDPLTQTTTSDVAKEQPQARTSMFDYQKAQASSAAGEAVPIFKTTRMRSRLRISGKEDQIQPSRKQSGSSGQSHSFKEQGSSEPSPQSSPKPLLGRIDSFFQRRLNSSHTDGSTAPRPALPPPSNP